MAPYANKTDDCTSFLVNTLTALLQTSHPETLRDALTILTYITLFPNY